MKGQIAILLICLCSTVTSAQTEPREVFAAAIDSMIRSHGFDPATTSVIADSAYRAYIKEYSVQQAAAMVVVSGGTSSAAGTEMSVSGTLVSLKPPQSSEVFTIRRQFSQGSVPQEEDVWDSVLQPVLVTLGAITIVALFFLIRS